MALTDNLVSYYKLDESSGNAADSVGSATLTNSNTTYDTGKINNGAISNGTSSRLYGTLPVDPDNYNAGFSISGWFYFNTNTNNQFALIIAESASWGSIIIGNDTSKLYYRFGTGVNPNGHLTSTATPTGSWNHIVITHAGTSDKMYLNGSVIDSSTGGTLANNGTTLNLLSNSGVNLFMDGKIDEVGIWTKELTSTEVTELYNSGTGLQYPFTTLNSGFFNFF
jgi:hypothetical protein